MVIYYKVFRISYLIKPHACLWFMWVTQKLVILGTWRQSLWNGITFFFILLSYSMQTLVLSGWQSGIAPSCPTLVTSWTAYYGRTAYQTPQSMGFSRQEYWSGLLFPSPVQFSSVAQSCPILCDPMNCSTPSLPVHHQLPEFTQTCLHWVGDAIQPSHPLSSPSPPALNPSQHQSLPVSQHFAWSGQSIAVSALASILPVNTQDWSPSEWTDWISLQSKGLSRVFSNTTVQKYQFFGAQLSSQSNSHIHTWPQEKP